MGGHTGDAAAAGAGAPTASGGDAAAGAPACGDAECGAACPSLCAVGAPCVGSDDCVSGVCLVDHCESALRVSYKTDVAAISEYIRPFLEIANLGQVAVPLAELEVRYFYTRDSTAMETADCYFATPGCDKVTLAFASIDPALPLADRVLSVTFEVGAPVLAANDLARFEIAVHKVDFDVYDQSGDYSFDASKTAYEAHAEVCLYHDGELIWGTEPGP